MQNRLKRYAMALLFLFLVIVLMLLGTLGVKDFGDKMFQDANITIQPEGEKLAL
jgi:hypothetical protein